MQSLVRNRGALTGGIIIVLLVLMALFADLITPYSFEKQSLLDANAVPDWVTRIFLSLKGYVVINKDYPIGAAPARDSGGVMSYVEVNGATIYYQSYGEDPSTALRTDSAPILLIHGATNDGQNDWGDIAPELARRYRVFVPDCRGHGRSNNPQMSYSFKELADDVAAFVRVMGYERAHIIGHSNGGNVALVTLMEHPEVIQTCIPQAANAYVTRYLIEREPKVFEPERMAREAPEWLHEIKSLHNEVHGNEYWRDLLWLTMKEIISEPNYSPAELRRVERPTLVIMGAEDTVNAPDEHAQYIANNIPDSELWIPEKTGHNVHMERRDEWIAKVLDFLKRRGS